MSKLMPSAAIMNRMLITGVLTASITGCSTNSSSMHVISNVVNPGAVAPNNTSIKIRRQDWRFAGADGQIITTPHYQIYTTLTDQLIVDNLLIFAEQSLGHYITELADLPLPRGKLEIYLFQKRDQWEAKTRQILPIQAETFLNLGRGGFTTRGRSVLYYIDSHGRTRDTFAIVAHEGWHQYAQTILHRQLPTWLEEGIATYMEGYIQKENGIVEFLPWANPERYRTLHSAVKGKTLIGIKELLTRSPQSFLKSSKDDLLVYYSQVWALVHFLNEGEGQKYKQALSQLLADATKGVSPMPPENTAHHSKVKTGSRARLTPGIILKYLEIDLDVFEYQYIQFIKKIVAEGGYNRIVLGLSPLTR